MSFLAFLREKTAAGAGKRHRDSSGRATTQPKTCNVFGSKILLRLSYRLSSRFSSKRGAIKEGTNTPRVALVASAKIDPRSAWGELISKLDGTDNDLRTRLHTHLSAETTPSSGDFDHSWLEAITLEPTDFPSPTVAFQSQLWMITPVDKISLTADDFDRPAPASAFPRWLVSHIDRITLQPFDVSRLGAATLWTPSRIDHIDSSDSLQLPATTMTSNNTIRTISRRVVSWEADAQTRVILVDAASAVTLGHRKTGSGSTDQSAVSTTSSRVSHRSTKSVESSTSTSTTDAVNNALNTTRAIAGPSVAEAISNSDEPELASKMSTGAISHASGHATTAPQVVEEEAEAEAGTAGCDSTFRYSVMGSNLGPSAVTSLREPGLSVAMPLATGAITLPGGGITPPQQKASSQSRRQQRKKAFTARKPRRSNIFQADLPGSPVVERQQPAVKQDTSTQKDTGSQAGMIVKGTIEHDEPAASMPAATKDEPPSTVSCEGVPNLEPTTVLRQGLDDTQLGPTMKPSTENADCANMPTELALRDADEDVFMKATVANLTSRKAASDTDGNEAKSSQAGNRANHTTAGDLMRVTTVRRRLAPATVQSPAVAPPSRTYPTQPLTSLDEVWADMEASRVVGVDWEAALRADDHHYPPFPFLAPATSLVPHLDRPNVLADIWDPVLACTVVNGGRAQMYWQTAMYY